MSWYGVKKLNWQNKVKNLKLRNKLISRTINMRILNAVNLNYSRISFHVPTSWKIIFLRIKNKKNHVLCYIFSDVYFFYLPVLTGLNDYYFDKYTQALFLNCLYVHNFFNTYWTFFKNIFFSFTKIFYKKLKFKGKGYYIYKSTRNSIATQFGHSHMSRLFNFIIGLKFLSKTLVLMYGINRKDVIKSGKLFFLKKPINVFTGRGIRFSRQIVYKKTGKLSTYR